MMNAMQMMKEIQATLTEGEALLIVATTKTWLTSYHVDRFNITQSCTIMRNVNRPDIKPNLRKLYKSRVLDKRKAA